MATFHPREQPPTLDDLVSRHGLEMKHLDRKIPAETILEMAQLLDDWKMTGYYLCVADQKLKDIKNDESCEEHRRVALLKVWEQQNGAGATYIKLVEAFYRQKKVDLVEKLCMRLTEIMRTDIGNSTIKADDPSKFSVRLLILITFVVWQARFIYKLSPVFQIQNIMCSKGLSH